MRRSVHPLSLCRLCWRSKNGEGDEDDSSDVMASKEPLLISGGLDCKVCAYSIQDFSNVRPIWILPVPVRGIVSASTDHEVVALRHRNMVDVWHLELNNADNMISTLNTSTSPIAESKKDKKKKDSEGDGGEEKKEVSEAEKILAAKKKAKPKYL